MTDDSDLFLNSESFLYYEILREIEGDDYTEPKLMVEALGAVVRMHKPHKVRHTDSNGCAAHSYRAIGTDMQFVTASEYEACPDCVVTHPDRCSSGTCLDCGRYPCETLRKIAEVLGL